MTEPPISPSVFELFINQARSRPDAPCIITDDDVWTYSRVAAQANALAVGLHHLGVEPGDRVAVDLPNWPEFVISTIAVAELGAVLVPLNPSYSPRELQFMLRNSEAVVAITAETWGETDYLQLFESLLVELPDLQYLVTVGEEDLWYDDRIFQFEDLVSIGRGREMAAAEVDPEEDVFAIMYTPGTDGAPKGVVLTHANVTQSAGSTAAALGLDGSDRTLCCVPLYHIFGLSAALLTAFSTGGAVILQDAFDAGEALDLAARHGATVLHGVPTMFVMMLREAAAAPRGAGTLRTGIIAGSAVSDTLVRDVREQLVVDIEIAYGLTETSPTVSITSPSDTPAQRCQTVGRPLPGVEIRIVDEEGQELPTESVGQLLVRGGNVMKGYFRKPGQTRKVLDDQGFLRTADLAMIDPEGYLHIVGRSSDVIIRGGYNVHPGEIEAVLRSHPAVEEAVVLGTPNDVLGELICACVVTTEGALITGDELKDFSQKSLAGYKIPDVIHFMDALPEAPSERARRVELARVVREEAASGSGEPV